MSEINKNRTVHRAVPRQFGATALCVLGCSLASNAGTIDYTFVNIADSTGPLSTSFDGAVVNDSGEVAFWVMLDISGQMRIYRGDGGPGGLTTIAAAGSGQQFDSLSYPSINSSGDVAFRATFPDGDAIYKYVKGAVIPITPGYPYHNVGERPSINDNGTVVFRSTYDSSYFGVYTGSGGDITMRYESSQGVFLSFGDPVINNNGLIAFNAGTFSGIQGVFRGSGGAYTPIADINGPYNGFGSAPDMNSAGDVEFEANRDIGGSGVYVGDENGVVTYVTTDGPYQFSAGSAGNAINDSGTVAMSVALGGGNFGIVTGPDPLQHKVIKTGDALFGSTVVFVSSGRDALNNHGDVAFEYALANGVSGIALAVAPAAVVPGDTNGDGTVDVADLLAVINAWGSCPQPCPPNCSADVNNDCAVDVGDLLMIINNWP